MNNKGLFCHCGKPAEVKGLCKNHYTYALIKQKRIAKRQMDNREILCHCGEQAKVKGLCKKCYQIYVNAYIRKRHNRFLTFKEVGIMFKISRQRVHQIYKKAFNLGALQKSHNTE